MGYVHVANDGTYLTDVLAMDFGNPDVITVNLGINDRSVTLGGENSTALDGTISGAIRNCCEVLGQKYPNAQIIFMTPINANDKGTFDTGWSKRGGGGTTLDALCSIIKYWCNKYGYTVIDMTHNCPINDYNIVPLFPDRLHPSKEAHVMIGKYLAGVLPHRN